MKMSDINKQKNIEGAVFLVLFYLAYRQLGKRA